MIKTGIKNLWKWRKVIWNDRDWDYGFLFKIMHAKLSFMQKEFETTNICVGQDKDAAQIKQTVELLYKLIADEYWKLSEDFSKEHECKQKDLDTLLTIISKNVWRWWT